MATVIHREHRECKIKRVTWASSFCACEAPVYTKATVHHKLKCGFPGAHSGDGGKQGAETSVGQTDG